MFLSNPPRALCELNDVNLLLEKQDRSIKSGLKVAGAAISGGSASCWPTSTAGLSPMVWGCSWLLTALQRQEHMSMRALENGGGRQWMVARLFSRVDARLSLIYIIEYHPGRLQVLKQIDILYI